MKRKSFLITSIAGIVSLHFPLNLLRANNHANPNLYYKSMPLLKVCSEIEIKELGQQYLMKYPEENSVSKLVSLLVNNDNTKSQSIHSIPIIQDVIAENIKNDYQTDKIVIINGYIISRTEARQTALYELHQN